MLVEYLRDSPPTSVSLTQGCVVAWLSAAISTWVKSIKTLERLHKALD